MNKIIVGFDSSDQGADALLLADSLRTSPESELIVVSVYELEPIFGETVEWREHRDAYYAANFERAAKVLGRGDFTERTSAGSVPGALDQIALAEAADVIVVGSTQRGTVGRILPGSVGDRLLAGAPCAVAIAPLGYARSDHFEFGRIGIAYDGETEARAALKEAIELALERNAELKVIGVALTLLDESLSARIGHTKGGYVEALHHYFEQLLKEAMAVIPDDLTAEALVLNGDPAREIAAQGVELDLLILGSRGYGPLRSTLLGGVARDVVTMAPCPVLVLPRSCAEVSEAREARDGDPALA